MMNMLHKTYKINNKFGLQISNELNNNLKRLKTDFNSRNIVKTLIEKI